MDVSDWAVAFEGKNVQQIVGFCGNGKLTNGSDCSKEFSSFLEHQNEAKLSEHARYCLENSFEKSGYVLQDVVNEIGRRIAYDVENGLYTGKKNAIGFDGIWKNGNEWIIVEVIGFSRGLDHRREVLVGTVIRVSAWKTVIAEAP